MLIDHHVEDYIEKNILPQQSLRRLANGSVDYTFRVKRAGKDRSASLETAARTVTAFVLRLIGVLIRARPPRLDPRQTEMGVGAAPPRARHGRQRVDRLMKARKPYSRAA